MKYLVKLPYYLLALILLIGCTDNDNSEIIEEAEIALNLEELIMSIPNNSFEGTELITLYGEAMKEVLFMAKDAGFRNYIYESSLSNDKAGGDFDVFIDDIIKSNKGNQKFDKATSKLGALSSKMQTMSNGLKPVVFFPKAETIEDQTIANKGFDTAKALQEPIAVMKGAYNDDYSAPGFKLDSNGELAYVGNITEEDAWENDVYVIGAQENVGNLISLCDSDCYSGGSGSGGGGSSSNNDRIDGRQEFGGLIQITSNLNEIEHWFSGKFEMRIIVSGVQGSVGTVIADFPFEKVKRKNFKNQKWYDYSAFLFNWNLSNLGDYNIEKWMEVDGGGNAEISISIPGSAAKPATSTTPAQSAFPGGSVKVKTKRDDDDLGTSIVQFSDKITQIYNLGKMNFRRK